MSEASISRRKNEQVFFCLPKETNFCLKNKSLTDLLNKILIEMKYINVDAVWC